MTAFKGKNLIRILIVEDSHTVAAALKATLNAESDFGVIGIARDGKEAVTKNAKLKPDLITMDVHLPLMDGIETTKEIMTTNPTPIVIVSCSIFTHNTKLVFGAIAHGAVDVIRKDDLLSPKSPAEFKKVIAHFKLFAGVKVIRRPRLKPRSVRSPVGGRKDSSEDSKDRIIAIVGSTGGPRALSQILKSLPGSLPWPIMVVIHIASGFAQGLVDWLDRESELSVHLAIEGEKVQPGVVYVAPNDVHLRLTKDRRVVLGDDPPKVGLKPCGDYLLESVGKVIGKESVGIILTGMGQDGTQGIQTITDAGGRTIAQDEASSAIIGMPKMAIQSGKVDIVLPLTSIAPGILSLLGRRKHDW